MGEKRPKPVTAQLQIHLLGTVEIVLNGRRLHAFNSLRLQRFIALIALRPDLRHRARLAFELWPDSDEPQARTNLRKLLHDVRQALPDIGELFEIDNDTIGLQPSETVEVDVWNFLDAIDAGDHESAARIYSGDLLPACYDEWLIDERARLRDAAHAALVQLSAEASERRDHEATIAYARRIIELEPTDDSATRFQMEAHIAVGDRAAALRAFHRCAAALERDLGVAPSEAIKTLYQQLRVDASESAEIQLDEPAHVAEPPFVGREVELNQLVEAWNAPLCFASPSPPSGWTGDLHSQAIEHAGHTAKSLAR